jgi:hypothetical protein
VPHDVNGHASRSSERQRATQEGGDALNCLGSRTAGLLLTLVQLPDIEEQVQPRTAPAFLSVWICFIPVCKEAL